MSDRDTPKGNTMDSRLNGLCSESATTLSGACSDGGTPIDYRAVEELARSMVDQDAELAQHAAAHFLSRQVEPWLDSFTEAGRRTYERVFARIVQTIRHHHQGRLLDEALRGFGLLEERDLLDRMARLRAQSPSNLAPHRIEEVFILSRVTVGADIAVVSPMIEKARLLFPGAGLFLLGHERLEPLLAGDGELKIIPIRYRTDTLLSRLETWHYIQAVLSETARGNHLILDPDSRLTQLGLLPLMGPEEEGIRYHLFESTLPDGEEPLSFQEAVNRWMDRRFDETPTVHARLRLSRSAEEEAQSFFQEQGLINQRVITINLGVGGNARKGLGDAFEARLLSLLLRSGATVLLDQGAGQDEILKTEALHRAVGGGERLLLKQSPLSTFAALVKLSSLYVGYDSMGQHIAAACGVPGMVIFRGYPNQAFLRRWTPSGKAGMDTILANSLTVNQVLAAVAQVLE